MADPTRTIEVKPLTLHIGAEIAGIDLSRPLPAGSRKAVSDALLKWKVVFFRGQHLDHAGHVAFARGSRLWAHCVRIPSSLSQAIPVPPG